MSGKIVLIDGHSILNRAFYGIPDLSNAAGLHTNAVYGFLNILFKILDEEKPEYLAVAFDVKEPTFRHKMFAEYKGTRKPMPKELLEQVPVIKEVLLSMGVSVLEKPGYEADDILGTLAQNAQQVNLEVSLVSGDRDLLQIASDHIKIRIPKTKGQRTEIEDYYTADVVGKYRVTPHQFIDVKALMGDSSDNIPGVPKVGEKTATDLVVQYGSLDQIYEHLEEITKKSIHDTLKENEHLARLSKTLATIDTHVELPGAIEQYRLGNLFTKEAYKIFKELEFKNFLSRFELPTANEEETVDYELVTDRENAQEVLKICKESGKAGIFAAGSFKKYQGIEKLAGIALCCGKRVWLIKTPAAMDGDELLKQLAKMSEDVNFSCFHAKSYYSILQIDSIEAAKKIFDIGLAAYLLNPLKSDYESVDIASEYLGKVFPTRQEAIGKHSFEKAFLEMQDQFVNYACQEAYTAYHAQERLLEELYKTKMLSLYNDIEIPLSYVLYDMEVQGISIRADKLKDYGDALIERIGQLESSIYEQAGTTFNINSPKQLGVILFENLELPGGKKTKTGYSTAADVLDKLSDDYPIISDILEYRGLTKLKSTYADGLANFIEEDGRIHGTFHQTITATGRISSTDPNLQNIPMRMELGRQIRKVFVPKDGSVLMDADYSQIELRILAHMSGDRQLIEAYQMDEDIHRITASKVFHTPLEEVSDLQRRNAKAVNFGIVYGISSFGLSQDLSISKKEAAEYIDQYFITYPQVKEYLELLVAEAKENGYVTTLYGRRRPVPELQSSNFMQRSFGERVAMNSPIQGTAADIMKIAMIRVFEELHNRKLDSKLILQVHDELLIETKKEEIEEVRKILEGEMKNAAQLAVTLEVDLSVGENWYEAKG